MFQSKNVGWVIGGLLAVAFPCLGGDVTVKVTAIPKTNEDKRNIAGNVAVGERSGIYRIFVKNLAFTGATPVLAAKYRVFFRRDDGIKRARDVKPERVEGEAQLAEIKAGESVTVETKAVKLKQTSLNPNFYYANYKRSATRDELAGIWVRIYQGDKMLAEYLSSSALAKAGPF